jgi:hypothetical protein
VAYIYVRPQVFVNFNQIEPDGVQACSNFNWRRRCFPGGRRDVNLPVMDYGELAMLIWPAYFLHFNWKPPALPSRFSMI